MEQDISVNPSAGGVRAPALFARVWRISGASYPESATIDAIVNTVIPQIERLQGYCGGYLLAEREGGAFLRVSFWDTLQHLHDADVMTTNAIAGVMVVTSGSTVSVDVCDVLMSDPPPPLRSNVGRRVEEP